jgi:hypothetical protein
MVAQFSEMRVRFQEDLLRHILGVRGVGEQTHGGAKYHVLVSSHERFELLRVCHDPAATVRASYARMALRRKTVA